MPVRLLVPMPAQAPTRVALSGARHHYLVHVLRLAEGAPLEVFDGQGRAFSARVEHIGTDEAVLALGSPRQAPPERPVHVLQGLPKGDKFELVLQKGTELGASAFHPVSTQRSVVKLEEKRAEGRRARWQKICEEAARQCGRSDVPAVNPVQALLEAAHALVPSTALLVLDEEEHTLPLSEAFHLLPKDKPVTLVIGPEGGLTREEVAALAALGAHPVTLGTRVLRTETAALAALSILRHLDGVLG